VEQHWCGKTQLSVCPQKVQHLDQFLMKPSQLDTECFSNRGAAKCMNIRSAEKGLVCSKCLGHYCVQCSSFLLYSVLFCEHI
jgi:hypothetical protein